jgi:hypothetical protein
VYAANQGARRGVSVCSSSFSTALRDNICEPERNGERERLQASVSVVMIHPLLSPASNLWLQRMSSIILEFKSREVNYIFLIGSRCILRTITPVSTSASHDQTPFEPRL